MDAMDEHNITYIFQFQVEKQAMDAMDEHNIT